MRLSERTLPQALLKALAVPATLLAAAATAFLFYEAVTGAARLGTELALKVLR